MTEEKMQILFGLLFMTLQRKGFTELKETPDEKLTKKIRDSSLCNAEFSLNQYTVPLCLPSC